MTKCPLSNLFQCFKTLLIFSVPWSYSSFKWVQWGGNFPCWRINYMAGESVMTVCCWSDARLWSAATREVLTGKSRVIHTQKRWEEFDKVMHFNYKCIMLQDHKYWVTNTLDKITHLKYYWKQWPVFVHYFSKKYPLRNVLALELLYWLHPEGCCL